VDARLVLAATWGCRAAGLQLRMKLAFLFVGTAGAFSICGSACCTSQRCGSPLAEGPPPLVPHIADGSRDMCPPVRIEGSSLRTWDLGAETTERVLLSLRSTSGRPIEASVELWSTPSFIPTKFNVCCEDGSETPVHTIIETPRHPKTLAVFNVETEEYPLEASVATVGIGKASLAGTTPDLVQGGQVASYTFGPWVESIEVLLQTEERSMKAMIELTQGPDDDNQTIELDAFAGRENPFYCVLMTPGEENTLRIINRNTVEYPFDAYVFPSEESSEADEPAVVMGSDGSW